MSRTILLLLGAAACSTFAIGSPLAEPKPQSFGEPEAPRLEVFGLELSTAAGLESIGWVEWRRRRVESGFQLECSMFFRDELLRIQHVERLAGPASMLVWRDLSAGHGRTVTAEWNAKGDELVLFDWGPEGRSRLHVATEGGAVLPLYLTELCRAGLVTGGTFHVLNPRSRRLELLRLSTGYGPVASEGSTRVIDADPPAGRPREAAAGEPGRLGERTVELVREDGTLAGRYAFEGNELVAFQWQAGGLVARRIDAAEHAALATEFEEASRPLAREPADGPNPVTPEQATPEQATPEKADPDPGSGEPGSGR